MIACLVCERLGDAELLQSVLPDEVVAAVKITECEDRGDASYVTRSRTRDDRLPTILFLNTGSVVPSIIKDQWQSMVEFLKIMGGGAPWKVLMVVPEMEALLFTDYSLVEHVFGVSFTAELRVLARFSPREALELLFTLSSQVKSRSDLFAALTPDQRKRLHRYSVVQDILAFLATARAFHEKEHSVSAQV